MHFERLAFRLRDLLASLTLLVGCSQVLGLEDGRDQGVCESNAECAPGYECRANACTLCASGSNCEDAPAAGSGGNNVVSGGKGSGGKSGASASNGDGGETSPGGAGGEPAQSGGGGTGGSRAGAAGVGGISIPPLPF